jgi:hypothetical protein
MWKSSVVQEEGLALSLSSKTYHGRIFEDFGQDACTFDLCGLAIARSRKIAQEEKVGLLHACKILLLLRHALFDQSPPTVGTTGWHHTAEDEKDIPQQKRHEFCARKDYQRARV